jgi:hypothetical protein
VALALPYEFDTSGVWRIILKGTFGLTLLITLSLLYTLASRPWAAAAPLALCSAMLFFITRLFLRVQTGSAGTLSADRVVIQPNRLLWFALPGPVGTYTLDRFSAVRIEFSMGPVQAGRARRAERGGLARGPAWHARHRAGAHKRRRWPRCGAGTRCAAQSSGGRGGGAEGDQVVADWFGPRQLSSGPIHPGT